MQGQYLTPRVVNLAMQYLTTAVSLGATWKALKPHVPQLLGAVVLPLCCFHDQDEELWQEDPQEYIRKVRAPLRTPHGAAVLAWHCACTG